MTSTTHRLAAAALLAGLLAGCSTGAELAQVPEGYHQMADGTLMADVDPRMEGAVTEFRLLGSGAEVATYRLSTGEVRLGSAEYAREHGGGHDHETVPQSQFPAGAVPTQLFAPTIDLTANVVTTSIGGGVIGGPPVAADLAWLEDTRRPGEVGPAIIGGVTAIGDEAGAYAALPDLAVGDEILVGTEDGDLLPYVVVAAGWTDVADRTAEVFAMGEGVSEVRLVSWDARDGQDYVVRTHAKTTDG